MELALRCRGPVEAHRVADVGDGRRHGRGWPGRRGAWGLLGLWSAAGLALTLRAGRPEGLEAEVLAVGHGLAVIVQDPDGNPYWGSLQVLIGFLQEGYLADGGYAVQGDTVTFEKGPYVVPALPSGRYTIQVLRTGPWIASPQDVDVIPRITSTCHVSLQPAPVGLPESLRASLLESGMPPR